MADGKDWGELWRWRLLSDLVELRERDDDEFLEGFLWSSPEDASSLEEQAYDKAFDSACAAVRRSQAAIRKDFAKRERALEMLFNPKLRYSSYRGIPLATVYLEFSYQERHHNHSSMLHFADKARFEAELARPEDHLPGVVYDVRARVWAELANAYRVSERYTDADSALRRAHEYLGKGSGDLALLARSWDVEASLRLAQRRLSEAQRLLEEAHRVYSEIGDSHLAGRALVKRAHVIYTSGDPVEAARVLETARPLLDPYRDPGLIQASSQALLVYLVDCGEYARASKLLLESDLREAYANEPINRLRLLWTEAKIHIGLGQLDHAENLFNEVRQGFLKISLEYDAALAGLDLAAVWLQQGKTDWLLPLAAEMCKTFDRMKLDTPEALRALTFLALACRFKVADLGLIQRTRSFLARYQGDRSLRFDPEALLEG